MAESDAIDKIHVRYEHELYSLLATTRPDRGSFTISLEDFVCPSPFKETGDKSDVEAVVAVMNAMCNVSAMTDPQRRFFVFCFTKEPTEEDREAHVRRVAEGRDDGTLPRHETTAVLRNEELTIKTSSLYADWCCPDATYLGCWIERYVKRLRGVKRAVFDIYGVIENEEYRNTIDLKTLRHPNIGGCDVSFVNLEDITIKQMVPWGVDWKTF